MPWALQRLAAMRPAEIAHRAGMALRDRLLPHGYSRWTAEEAATRAFAGDPLVNTRLSALAGGLTRPLAAADFGGTLAAADGLEHGRWNLFGHAVSLADPPEWSRDPLSGHVWPDAPSRQIDTRGSADVGGVKPVWELGRLTMLPTLALSARVGGDPRHAERARRWLADFARREPLGRGVQHASGIEMAVRVLTGCATLAWLDAPARGASLHPALGQMAQQALYLRDHLSLGSSANNHLIAEYAAMTAMGAAFPSLHDGERLLARGHDGLVHETLAQIHDDGVPAEQAFSYLPFVWELLLISFVLAEAAGRPTPRAVRERLGASLEFARWVRLPDGGMPHIGDEDDGRILLADETGSRLDLVGAALAAWLGAEGPSHEHPALARVLFGRDPAARTVGAGSRTFEHGGYTVWRSGLLLATFDHGPLGLGALAAHGHADLLALTLHRGADGIVVDPGTLAYQEDPAARDRCRSTPAHATVHFGGRSQSEMRGPFLWGARARVARDEDGWRAHWVGGERHSRAVTVEDDLVTVRDRVEGSDPTLVFPLAAGANVRVDGRRAQVSVGTSRAEFTLDGAGPWRVEDGEVSERFSHRAPAPRLVAPITEPRARTVIELARR